MTIDDFKFEMKRKLVKTWNFCVENKELVVAILAVLSTIIAGSTNAVETIAKKQRLKEEKKLKNRMIYDRSLGGYLETKRDLTNRDKVEIARRHQNGESLTAILDMMGLLK